MLGVSSEKQMPRRMKEDVEGLGGWGSWGISQPVVSERNKGRWWKHFGQHSSSRRVLQDCTGVFKPKWLVRGVLGLLIVDPLRVPAFTGNCW